MAPPKFIQLAGYNGFTALDEIGQVWCVSVKGDRPVWVLFTDEREVAGGSEVATPPDSSVKKTTHLRLTKPSGTYSLCGRQGLIGAPYEATCLECLTGLATASRIAEWLDEHAAFYKDEQGDSSGHVLREKAYKIRKGDWLK